MIRRALCYNQNSFTSNLLDFLEIISERNETEDIERGQFE